MDKFCFVHAKRQNVIKNIVLVTRQDKNVVSYALAKVVQIVLKHQWMYNKCNAV
jgi:hypothetical protein